MNAALSVEASTVFLHALRDSCPCLTLMAYVCVYVPTVSLPLAILVNAVRMTQYHAQPVNTVMQLI
jgi:hypothetical protein